MKNIEVKYNENGKITNVSDNSLHFEQENESLCIKAQLTVDDDKSVRAYIKGPNNNSDVTDAITKDGEYYSLVIRNEYMSKGTLYIGFEVFNDSGYIERYEPLKVYIDGFVNPGNGSSDNVYVVTVDVAEVETLEPDTPAYVENVGTKKDMRLKFGIPQGKQGIQGEPGKDATIKIGTVTTLEPGSKATVINNGTQSYAILNFGIPKGEKGDTGEQGVQGEPGYTPVKGEDYYTPEERETFKAEVIGEVEKAKDYTDEKVQELESKQTFNYGYDSSAKETYITGVTFNSTGNQFQLNDLYARQRIKTVNNNIAGMQQRINGIDYDLNQVLVDSKAYTDEKFQEVDIYGVHARLDAFNDAFNQYDISLNDITNTLGDINIALDSIIAMQNELTGGGEV